MSSGHLSLMLISCVLFHPEQAILRKKSQARFVVGMAYHDRRLPTAEKSRDLIPIEAWMA